MCNWSKSCPVCKPVYWNEYLLSLGEQQSYEDSDTRVLNQPMCSMSINMKVYRC